MVNNALFSKAVLLVFILFPIIAKADLVLVNDSNYYVSSISAGGACAGENGGYLAPHSSMNVPTAKVAMLCGFKSPCTAKFITSDKEADVKQCKGVNIGSAQIKDLLRNIISSITVIDTHYKLSGVGSNHLTLNEASFSFKKLFFN